jgi:hypothetical protein
MVLVPYYSYKIRTSAPVTTIVDGLTEQVHLVDDTSNTPKPFFGFVSSERFKIRSKGTHGSGSVITGRFVRLPQNSRSSDLLIKVRIRAPIPIYIMLGFFIPNLLVRLVNNVLTGSGSWLGHLAGILFLWIGSTLIFSFYVREFKCLMDNILKEGNAKEHGLAD